MATNKIRKFTTIDELQFFLNGAVIGADVSRGVAGLTGRTLKLGSGPTTVTFTATANNDTDFFNLQDIKSQVEAQAPTFKVVANRGFLVIIESTPTNGVLVDHTGTANTLLGFDTAVDTAGKFYGPPGVASAPPQWTWIESTGENQHLVATWE